jgi:trehalose utilization protein
MSVQSHTHPAHLTTPRYHHKDIRDQKIMLNNVIIAATAQAVLASAARGEPLGASQFKT